MISVRTLEAEIAAAIKGYRAVVVGLIDGDCFAVQIIFEHEDQSEQGQDLEETTKCHT